MREKVQNQSVGADDLQSYIAKGLFLNLTQEELPRHGKKKHKYKKVKKNKAPDAPRRAKALNSARRRSTSGRSSAIGEGDTVYSGKGKRKTTRALLTLTERKTRKEIIIAIPNRKAETVVKALDALERKLGARRFRAIFKSITFDNGTEFAAAEELERLLHQQAPAPDESVFLPTRIPLGARHQREYQRHDLGGGFPRERTLRR